jgi:uncharacterized protein YjbJ (UPF0337 family)
MGVGEKVKGAVKEKLGQFVDRDDLRAEGSAQQRKGEHEMRETEQRARATAHEEKAAAYERRQDDLEDR